MGFDNLDTLARQHPIHHNLGTILQTDPGKIDAWFLNVQDKRYGPYTSKQMIDYLKEGRVTYKSLCQLEGDETWSSVQDILVRKGYKNIENGRVAVQWRCIARKIVLEMVKASHENNSTRRVIESYGPYFLNTWLPSTLPEEMLILGDAYEYGIGVPKDSAKAAEHFLACLDDKDALLFMVAHHFLSFEQFQNYPGVKDILELTMDQLTWIRTTGYVYKYKFLLDYLEMRKSCELSMYGLCTEGMRDGDTYSKAMLMKQSYNGDYFFKHDIPKDVMLAKKLAKELIKELKGSTKRRDEEILKGARLIKSRRD